MRDYEQQPKTRPKKNMMETKEEIFEKHWNEVTNTPLDDQTKQHMKYVLDAMEEYAVKFFNHNSQNICTSCGAHIGRFIKMPCSYNVDIEIDKITNV